MDSPTPPTESEIEQRALGDVMLIAAVYLLPNIYAAFECWFLTGSRVPVLLSELNLAVRAAGYSVLGLFLILRSGEPAVSFGLARLRVSDLFLGFVLWLGLFVVQYAAGVLIPQDLFGVPDRFTADLFTPPRTPLEYALVALASCLNGFGEEVVMKAVLQTRLERLMRSAANAIMLTAVLFALYHAYYGWSGAIICGLFGLVMGIAFRLGKSLWPVVIAHAMQDFFPFLWLADVTN